MARIAILCAASTICAAYFAATTAVSASVSQTNDGTPAVSRPSPQTNHVIALNPQPLPPRRLPNRTTPKYRTKT
jgi:hypothetical protein